VSPPVCVSCLPWWMRPIFALFKIRSWPVLVLLVLDFLLGAHANFSVWHQVASLSLLARYFLSCDFSRQLLSTGEGFSRTEYLAAAVVLRAHALFFCLRWFQSYRALL
jgi:hypothetical protein